MSTMNSYKNPKCLASVNVVTRTALFQMQFNAFMDNIQMALVNTEMKLREVNTTAQ